MSRGTPTLTVPRCLSYVLEFEKAVFESLRVMNLKTSTAGAFTIPFRVLSRKKYGRRYLTINFTS